MSSNVPAAALDCRGLRLDLTGRTQLVGILNVTPVSFSDGGQWLEPEAAAVQGVRLAAEGAAIIDLGGQSTRPGHAEISASEEIARIRPVLERLAGAGLPAPISIDTYKPAVARAALAAGARLVNDIHGFQGDPEMAGLVAEYGCPAVLMHHERDFSATAGDVIAKIARYFERSLALAATAGVPETRLILDPGIGFWKSQAENLEIMARLAELKTFGRPLLLGVSRKSVVARIVGESAEARLAGTLATTVMAVSQGVDFVRVHDVAANAQAIKMAVAIRDARHHSPTHAGPHPTS